MDPFLDEDQSHLRVRVRAWVKRSLPPAGNRVEDLDEAARKLVRSLGKAGFIAHVAPKKFGGIKDSVQARDLCVIREELARGSALADTMFAVQALGSYPIVLAGNERQKARYLPSLARGEAIAAFALSEPEAGSDISAIATRGVKRGKRYHLTGVKHLISNAGIADTYVVFVATDPEKKAKGISAFVVPADTPGLICKERTALLSPHPIGVIAFEDCSVPETQLLGQEGDGYKIALRTLETLRCTVGAAAVGLAQRALEEALRYSQERRQFGKALADFQAIRFK
ncbi:MAG: acyl-CoA dehydrogenase family protein, partial [Candidatus Binatia bacterium]